MTIREIDQALAEGESLKQIAQAYSEIANLRLKRIRNQAIRNRVFFEEISYVYGLVKALAYKKKVKVTKSKKTISLIITSNYRFYGSINSALIDFYIATTQKFATDRLLIGKAALDYFRAQPQLGSYQQIVLASDMPDAAKLQQIVDIIKDYNQVLIFYSKLKSLLVQIPDMMDLSTTKSQALESSQIDFKFIFEPELPKILTFFDSQILTLLLEDAFLESELSRTAARFISMDQAESAANKFIKENLSLQAYAKRNQDNNTILENFASLLVIRKQAI